MAKAASRSPNPAPTPIAQKWVDIAGLCLIFTAIACMVSLVFPQSAPVPRAIAHGLRLLTGEGSYFIALALLCLGVMLLAGVKRIPFTHATVGAVLLFLTLVTEQHIQQIPAARLDPSAMEHAGGWLGGLMGYPLYTLLQRPLSYLLLTFTGLTGLILLIDMPVKDIVTRMHLKSRRIGSRVYAGADEDDTVTARQAVVRSRASRTSLGDTDATTRPVPLVRSGVDDDHPAVKSRFPNLFNLSGPWGRNATADSHDDSMPTDVAIPSARVRKTREAVKPAALEPTQSPEEVTVGDGAPVAVVPANPKPEGNGIKDFALPPLTLLNEAPSATSRRTQTELKDRVSTIEKTLEQFNIGANVVEVASGPSITRYEIQLAPGIKVSKIVSLADNLAMSLAAIDVRVEAPIPGKSAIGVEVPNETTMIVSLRECLDTPLYRDAPSLLTFALGKDVTGQFRYADITKMPHLLIGGSTNSGKSVCLNALIASLVYRANPDEVRLLMIDPKRVELSLWDGIPHLMHPVVKDVRQAAGIFREALREMDRRYDRFAAIGTRNIDGYNQRVPEAEKLPYVVLIVDELADLMMQQGPEIENSICRLAQLARATGIHLVLATQRPSVDIITGTIKANIAARIAFAVASQIDSRTILDTPGADRLIGRGDMLFACNESPKPVRIQGCYMSEDETNRLVAYLKEQEKPTYTIPIIEPTGELRTGSAGGERVEEDVDDQLMEQAVKLVVNNGQASTSMLQRRFRIGYTRAARIVEMMEERGIVGPLNGAKPREILVSRDDVDRMYGGRGAAAQVNEMDQQ